MFIFSLKLRKKIQNVLLHTFFTRNSNHNATFFQKISAESTKCFVAILEAINITDITCTDFLLTASSYLFVNYKSSPDIIWIILGYIITFKIYREKNKRLITHIT